jgi:D-aminopeptidase
VDLSRRRCAVVLTGMVGLRTGYQLLLACCALALTTALPAGSQELRPRARDLGIVVGEMRTGEHNAITDVPGVRVGHVTVIEGDTVNTGVTAILPHAGNIFRARVPAAVFVLNGFGKMLGIAQVQELGELETPILLTCTLCVWKAADVLAQHLLAQPEMVEVRSINVVVGETNDGWLNDIRRAPIRAEHVVAALANATGGPVAEGSVGAGRGTVAFGWKGGIGTSSRRFTSRIPPWDFTVGVLVQSNFGGTLTINGAPVGRALRGSPVSLRGDGSIMIVVATDAPLSSANLARLARRAALGLARTGSSGSDGSGDFIIAFSTAESVRREHRAEGPPPGFMASIRDVPHQQLDGLFRAVIEATEEAIYNSLFKATTVAYRGRTIQALPIARTLEVLRRHSAVTGNR